MQKNLLNSSSIRLQIAKGGTNDLQLHLNRYRVSVHYTTSKPYRLIAVVFQVAHSGMVPLVRFAFPADESVLATDYKTFVRLIYDIDKKGRNEVAILHDDGVVFVSGVWEIEDRLCPPRMEEFEWGIDRNTERWNVKL